jgi:hypothetical protein
MSRREVLTLFSFAYLDGKVLESFINNLQVGVEQLDVLKE